MASRDDSCTRKLATHCSRGVNLVESGHRSVKYADLCGAWLPVCHRPQFAPRLRLHARLRHRPIAATEEVCSSAAIL
jgi:hypothetical protein